MENFNSKLKNFWFYYKKHVLIGIAALAVLTFLGIQKASTPKPDYHIALVQAVPALKPSLRRWSSASPLPVRILTATAGCW